MKILITMNLPYFPAAGGANKGNRRLAEGLAKNSHSVQVVVPALASPSAITRDRLREAMQEQGITADSRNDVDRYNLNDVAVHAVYNPAHLRNYFIEQVNEFDPDWCFVSTEDPSQNLLDAALKASPGRVAYLVHSPMFLPFGPYSLFPGSQRTNLIKQAAVIACGKFVAQYIRRWSGVEALPFYFPAYGTGPFKTFGRFDEGRVTMINPCAFKGISIFCALAQILPDVEFAAVPGWGTTTGDLASLKKLPNVKLLEPQEDVDSIYSQAKVILMPSLIEEGFPFTPIEAMLRGIPVLASEMPSIQEALLGAGMVAPVRPIEGFKDTLDDRHLPIAVAPEQPIESWRKCLLGLLSNPKMYQAQAASGREAASTFIKGLGVRPLEALLDRLALGQGKPKHGPEDSAPGNANSSGARDTLMALSPETRAALIARLKQKAAIRSESHAPSPGLQPVPKNFELPLSFAQQRLWFLHELEPENPSYNMPSVIRLGGDLDLHSLERAFTEIVNRHQVLRTVFQMKQGRPVQIIGPAQPLKIKTVDLTACREQDREKVAKAIIETEATRPLNLSTGPLLRVGRLLLTPDDHVLLFTLPHIACDGWSIGILLDELSTLYEAFRDGKPWRLPPLPIQYADYAVWQREQMNDEALAKHIAFWKGQLRNSHSELEFPWSRLKRGELHDWRGALAVRLLAKRIADAVGDLSITEGVTPFMLTLAAFNALLSSYTGGVDIVVGTDVAGRDRAEIENLIGFFVNQIVLRNDLSGNPTFCELLHRVRETTLNAYAHQELPFEKLVEVMCPERQLARTPLFQVKFVYHNTPARSSKLSGLTLKPIETTWATAKFDLLLNLTEHPAGLVALMEYSTALLDASKAEQILADFELLLDRAVSDPQVRLETLCEMIAEAEKRRVHERSQRFKARIQTKLLNVMRRQSFDTLSTQENN